MREVQIRGHAVGKKKGILSATAIRIILPLPCMLAVLDAHMAQKMPAAIQPTASTIGRGFLEAARKGRQILDLVHP